MTEIVAPERITVVSTTSSSYAAIYVDGVKTAADDFEDILERVLELAGIELRFDNGFLRSGDSRDIAPTLSAIDAWNAGEPERQREREEAIAAEARAYEEAARAGAAAEKRIAAQRLLAEADALDADL